MRAVLVSEFGGPEQLRPVRVADPVAGAGQVRVAVRAAGVNPVDAGNRADGRWAGLRVPCILGYDIAGVIDGVGPGVTGLAPGDRVMAMTHFPDGAGGYAELVVIDAALVAPISAATSFADAAATPLAAGTAHLVLTRLGLPAGRRLLVLGASGGVGLFLLQLAAAAGIITIGVGREAMHAQMRGLGAAAGRADRRDRNAGPGPGPAARRQHHLPRRAHPGRREPHPRPGRPAGPARVAARDQPRSPPRRRRRGPPDPGSRARRRKDRPRRRGQPLIKGMTAEQEAPRVVSATREIAAGAGQIFELVADPAAQPRWDGNDNLASAPAGQRVRRPGDVFAMTLTRGEIRENHVVEFEEGRRIAWTPAEPGKVPPGHLWRWELEPVDPSRTRVTHTYDWTRLTDEGRLPRARATTADRLRASLDRLAALAEES